MIACLQRRILVQLLKPWHQWLLEEVYCSMLALFLLHYLPPVVNGDYRVVFLTNLNMYKWIFRIFRMYNNIFFTANALKAMIVLYIFIGTKGNCLHYSLDCCNTFICEH